jgi:hypothetical protein
MFLAPCRHEQERTCRRERIPLAVPEAKPLRPSTSSHSGLVSELRAFLNLPGGPAVARTYSSRSREEVVAHSQRVGDDGQRRIDRSTGRKETAVDDI